MKTYNGIPFLRMQSGQYNSTLDGYDAGKTLDVGLGFNGEHLDLNIGGNDFSYASGRITKSRSNIQNNFSSNANGGLEILNEIEDSELSNACGCSGADGGLEISNQIEDSELLNACGDLKFANAAGAAVDPAAVTAAATTAANLASTIASNRQASGKAEIHAACPNKPLVRWTPEQARRGAKYDKCVANFLKTKNTPVDTQTPAPALSITTAPPVEEGMSTGMIAAIVVGGLVVVVGGYFGIKAMMKSKAGAATPAMKAAV